MPPEDLDSLDGLDGQSVGFLEDLLELTDEFEVDAACMPMGSEGKPSVQPIHIPVVLFELHSSEAACSIPAKPRPSLAGRPPCEWLGGPLGATPRSARQTPRVELTWAESAAQNEAVAIVAASIADERAAKGGSAPPDRTNSYSWSDSPWLDSNRKRCHGEVVLSVYDATRSPLVSALNHATAPLGAGGAFHVAIVVWDHEWSFGLTRSGSGVSWVAPGQDSTHQFRGSLLLGTTNLSRSATHRIIKELAREWQGSSYHPLRRNCCHFAQNLAETLGVGPLPDWVGRLGRTCESLVVPMDEAVATGRRAVGTFRSAFRLVFMPWQECCGKDGAVVLSKTHASADSSMTPRPLGAQKQPTRAASIEWC